MTRAARVRIQSRYRPPLDPQFVPAALWNRAYRRLVEREGRSETLRIALQRPDGTGSVFETKVLPYAVDNAKMNNRYVERLVKFLLWQRGGQKIIIGGEPRIAEALRQTYGQGGARAFDSDLIGRRVYGELIAIENCAADKTPELREADVTLGRNLDGCRIGFDLGGSDRKCAAVVDGKVVHSEEAGWDPYFQKDPQYHVKGVADIIERAAAKLPRVDAIGGSAAGIYVNNEPRVASLFRGLSEDDFTKHIRPIFHRLRERWNDVPFEVANDGEVTALAGSMFMNDNSVVGISMGTSQAGGYVSPKGCITQWLNELGFVPVDYRENAPVDEWSGDKGCGAQYFSQMAVARLAPVAGIELPADMPLPERLVRVQELAAAGDERATRIYETIGVYLGYTVAHYADFYEMRNLLILGRVMSGNGGTVILKTAETLLANVFPEMAEKVRLRTPDEQFKRHGQAIAAASLPKIVKKRGDSK